MKKNILKIASIAVLSLFSVSCLDDLNTEPKYELTIEQILARDPNGADGIVSKIYGTFALSGADGAGSSDIEASDAGESAFLRGIVNLQDFTADGMKNRWGDDGLDQLTTTSGWNKNNKFFRYLYDRAYYTIPQATNIIQQFKVLNVENRESYISELRFLRALSYYYIMDCFGKGVLVTDETYGTTTPLPEASRAELFNYVESELLAVESAITADKVLGHADKHVVRTLLAKLYLNAEVYTGTAMYDKALKYSELVINEGGYTLDPDFVSLFSSNNNNSQEIIFPLLADANFSQSYGNTTYIVNGSLNSATMTIDDYGATGGWGGHRASKAWYGLYNDNGVVDSELSLSNSLDDRAKLFWTTGHNFSMSDYKEWTHGYPSIKFRNTDSTVSGQQGSTEFSSTNFPLFRLADVYLMYAEANLRGGGGDNARALQLVNDVRTRSNAPAVGSIDLPFILDERARELNLEGHRRTDLIRFGAFTGGSYIWPWKGGSATGTAISDDYNLFPIPEIALSTNPNLTQNPGY